MATRTVLRRTTSRDPAFIALTQRLDAELWERYGAIQAAYELHDELVSDTAVLALHGKTGVGCGCFLRYDETTAELVRMFVARDRRGRGIGRAIVRELETWATELGFWAVVLETGIRQPEAIELYEASGYRVVDNFGPFVGLEHSVCLRKQLR